MTKLQRSAVPVGIALLAALAATRAPSPPGRGAAPASVPVAGPGALAVGLLGLAARRGSRNA